MTNLLAMRTIGIFIFFLLFLQLQGQSHWGIKAGLVSQSLAEDEFLFDGDSSFDDFKLDVREADYGFQFGMLYHFEISNRVFIQPEILFNSSSHSYALDDLENGNADDVILKEKFAYLDFPVQLGLLFHPFQFGAGIVPQIMLDNSSELSDLQRFEQGFENVSYAWTAGAGIDIFKTFKFEVRYENSEELLGRTIIVDNERYDFDSRVSQWIFSLALIF
jgi:hypothetical protein